MIAKTAVVSTRAPRGTRLLARAFLSAAEEIPEGRRADAVKAALSLIRDQIKESRDKAKRVNQQHKIKPFKPPLARGPGRPKKLENAPEQTSVLQPEKKAAASVGRPRKKSVDQKAASEKTAE